MPQYALFIGKIAEEPKLEPNGDTFELSFPLAVPGRDQFKTEYVWVYRRQFKPQFQFKIGEEIKVEGLIRNRSNNSKEGFRWILAQTIDGVGF